MTRQLVAAAILAALGCLWAFVCIKSTSNPSKTISFLLTWAFLGAATVVAALQVWRLLS